MTRVRRTHVSANREGVNFPDDGRREFSGPWRSVNLSTDRRHALLVATLAALRAKSCAPEFPRCMRGSTLVGPRRDRRRDAAARLRSEPDKLPAGLARDVPASRAHLPAVGRSGPHVVASATARRFRTPRGERCIRPRDDKGPAMSAVEPVE